MSGSLNQTLIYVITNAFAKTGFRNALEDHEVFQVNEPAQSVDTESEAFRNVFETMQLLLDEPLDVTAADYIDIDARVVTKPALSDDQIIDRVLAAQNSDSEDEIIQPSAKVSFAEAFHAVQLLKAYCMQHQMANDMHKVEQDILDSRFRTNTQRRIDDYFKKSTVANNSSLFQPDSANVVDTEVVQTRPSVGAESDAEVRAVAVSEGVDTTYCILCKAECGGAHLCKVYFRPVHAIETCSTHESGEEGYGQAVTCLNCALSR